MGVLAKGSKLNIGDNGSPLAYEQLLGVEEIQVPDPEVASLENTNHDTTNKNRTKEPGLIEPGDMSVMYFVDKTNTEQAQLVTDRDAGTIRSYQTIIPSSPEDTQTFKAFVKKIETATPIDGRYTKRAILELTEGVVTS